MDGMQNDLSQKIDNIQYSISRLTNLNTVNEKGKFPSQPSPNPKGVHEVETQDEESSKLREVKAVITLRSGKEVDQPLPKVRQDEEFMSRRTLVKESNNKEEKSGKKNASKSSIEEEPRIVIKEDMMKKHMPPLFLKLYMEIRESRIHQKFLNVSLQLSTKIRDVPPFQLTLEDTCGEALLDLGESVNLLPYSVYKQLGLGGLKPTTITLSLADRSVKIPRGVIEDILVQVDKFYYPVDFVVLDTNPTEWGDAAHIWKHDLGTKHIPPMQEASSHQSFPLQHRVQRRGAILEALFLISEGYYFGPHHLIMASLLHFEEKVPKRHLMRADTILLLFPRLLCHVLAHMGIAPSAFPRTSRAKEVPPQPLPSIFAPSTSAPSEPVPEVASSDAPPAVPPTLELPITIPGDQQTLILREIQQHLGLLPPAPPVSLVPSEPFVSTDGFDPSDDATPVAVPSTVAVEDPSYPPEEPTT
ncbi:hypothetical protein CK203_089779 [Vitis vinifera]|uniref:Uncharacterized protein n=1 Tax=Vitis vinifera TaxID=29760 RepID=A0A438BLG4_VITVI|nr:hypothetical protein CK203_089779 [Vitis vinifera]